MHDAPLKSDMLTSREAAFYQQTCPTNWLILVGKLWIENLLKGVVWSAFSIHPIKSDKIGVELSIKYWDVNPDYISSIFNPILAILDILFLDILENF